MTVDRVLDPLEYDGREPAPKAVPSRWAGLVVALVVPLVFVAMFAMAYISAFHDPAPHDAPLSLVGPASVTESIIAVVESSRPGAFSIDSETDIVPALELLRTRAVIGVVEIRSDGVIAHTAAAAGNGTAASVSAVANAIAQSMGLAVSVVDEVPAAEGDGTGSALFYMLMICTIGAYIAVMVLPGVAGGLGLAWRFAFAAVIAVLAPALTFAIASPFVGNFGLEPGRYMALVGVAVLYTLIVGVIALFAERLVGQASMVLTMFLIMVLNLPSTGGPIAAAVLPPFWQWVHSFWFGSAAMEAMRSITYFPDAAISGLVGALVIWCIGAVFAVLALEMIKSRLRPGKQLRQLPG